MVTAESSADDIDINDEAPEEGLLLHQSHPPISAPSPDHPPVIPAGSRDPAVPPIVPVERTLASGLDRSLSAVRRAVAAEFSGLLRSSSQATFSVDFDDFTDGLLSEVSDLISEPVPGLAGAGAGLAVQISAAIDGHTRPLSAAMAESASRNSTEVARHLRGLKRLQRDLDSLRSAFASGTDGALRGLERDRLQAIADREFEQSRERALRARSRTAARKTAELEAQALLQRSAGESLERAARELQRLREEFEDNFAGEGWGLRARIQREIAEIGRAAAAQSRAETLEAVDDGLRILAQDRIGLRAELESVALANRWAGWRMQSGPPRPRPKSPAVLSAEARVRRLRRHRVSAIRAVTGA
jgi:hypothetical protein